MRSALEGLLTRLATPKLTELDVGRLRALHTRMQMQAARPRPTELRRLNREFHRVIYEGAQAPRILEAVDRLWLQFPWDTLNVIPGRLTSSAQEHLNLIEALEAGDGELAGQLMQDHINAASKALFSYLEAGQRKELTSPAGGTRGSTQSENVTASIPAVVT